jgi:hypothetical protein
VDATSSTIGSSHRLSVVGGFSRVLSFPRLTVVMILSGFLIRRDIQERDRKHMNLRLASSADSRALAIRDHLLPLVREHGKLENQRGPVRLIGLQVGLWAFRHWTPFNVLGSGEASSPGYRHAIERQHTMLDLPYGLDVWHEGKVLSTLWAENGSFDVVSFVRGRWEDEALAMTTLTFEPDSSV